MRAVDRRKAGDNYGAMSDYNMVIKINADEGAVGFAYILRSYIKANVWGDKKGACEDIKIASSLKKDLKEVYVINGGINAWKSEGFPIVN